MTTPTAGIAVTAAADAVEDQKQLWIAAQFIGLIFRRVPVAAALNIVNAGILVFVLRDAVNAPLRFTWLGLIVAAMAVRVLLWRRYERADPRPGETPRWSRRFTASMAAAGLLWGAAAILFFVPGEPALQAYLAVAVGGMAAGALISVGAYPPAYRAFCMPIVFPLAVRFIFHGNETSLVTGFLIAAFGIVLLFVSDTLHRNHADFFALRADNADLVGILSAATEAAKSAELAKAAFLGGISHELRTPLNAVIGFSEILKDELFGSLGQPQYRDYAKLIHDSADHLLDVINEIIDIADAASGRIELNDESVDLPRLAAGCADLIAARAGANAPRIATDFRCGLPNLKADARRIRQILLNLLSNAVKFTPPQGRIDIVAGPDNNGGVLLIVRDTGVGMEAGDAARATEPFGSGNVWLARRSAGAGVGLPLTKALVELHGGTLSVESAPGQGTSVTVRFPKQRSLPRGEAS
jgi:two-component system cell cycle sensor histidine kinase PleC